MASYQTLTQSSQLTFDDEFNSFVSSPNGTVGWMTRYPYAGESSRAFPNNTESEFLSDSSVGVNPFSVSNGVLDITATVAAAGSNPYGLPYNSGVITSYQSLSQTYGYFEMDAELPAGVGLWPTFYLLPTSGNGSELDVFEAAGGTPNSLLFTVHWEVNGATYATSDTVNLGVNATTSFNTYGVDWEPTTTTFYFDGQALASIPTPPEMDVPMYLLASLQTGTAASFVGAPTSASEFPATLQINDIRVYATANTVQVGGTAAILTSAIDGQVLLGGVGAAGIAVALLNAAQTVIATQVTSATGNFAFTGLAAGDYQVLYTPPAGDGLLYRGAANQATGLTATLVVADGQTLVLPSETVLAVDPGPSGGGGSITVGHGQTVSLTSQLQALIDPGFAGDTETITAVRASAGSVALGAGGAVTYTAPASGTATLTYTVTDQLGDSATLSTALVTDPGPQLAAGGSSIVQGTTASLGAAVAALIGPGLAGDTETITSVSAAHGKATLGANGAITYVAPSSPGTDTLTYTVVDQYGDTATGSYAVTVLPTPASLSSHTMVNGAALSGVTVSLINSAGTVVGTTVSAAGTGYYSFTAISPGTYQLGFSDPAGVVYQPGGLVNVSTGLTAPFTLTSAQSYAPASATYVAAAAITGLVVAAGTGQAGVAVTLLNSAGGTVASTTSGSGGSFSFGQLEAGSYEVAYTAPSGQALLSGPANDSTGLTSALTLTAGQTLALAAETLTPPPATLTGSVTYGGAGQAGVTVALLNAAGGTVATATSGSGGAFSFGNLAAGSYEVQYTAPSGEVLQSGPASDSTGLTGSVTLAAGQTLALAAETLAPAPATLTGSVTYGGVGQSGVAVTLLNAAGATVATTTSGANGAFSFAGLAAGTYEVQYTAPSGEVLLSGPANDSTGLTGSVTLAAGQTLALAAETLAPAPATLTGAVTYGGAGQAGVTVTLLNAFGGTVATATSGSGGAFSFGNLAAGTYEVQYTAPSGEVLLSGPANTGTGQTGALALAAGQTLVLAAETLAGAPATLTGSVTYGGVGQAGVTVTLLNAAGAVVASTASDATGAFGFSGLAAGAYQVGTIAPAGEVLQSGPANATTGLTSVVTLAAGQTLALSPETLAPAPATLTGSVRYGGSGQSGVMATLLNAAGTAVATTTSGANGAFSFAGLTAGTYQVQYTAPAGEVLQSGPANPSTGLTAAVTVAAGQTVGLGPETLAAATAAPATLTGTVIDQDAALAGVTVTLLNSAGAVVATTTSGANGGFSFTGLAAGSYQAQYTIPSGDVLLSGPANARTGLTAAVTLAAGQTQSLGIEALGPASGSPVALATLQSHTAILGPAYPAWGGGLGGVTVSLINSAGLVVATTTSAAGNGYYVFTGITPGTYQLGFSEPAGVVFQPGGSVTVGSGLTAPFTLTAGQSSIPANANYVAAAAVTGSVVEGGAGQAGVAVTLLTAAGAVVSTTTTASDGSFGFGQLEAGGYQVQYMAPSGQVLLSGPADDGTGLTPAVTLTAGQTLALAAETLTPGTATAAATLTGTATCGGAGVAGVTVTLLDGLGDPLATTTTDGTGTFGFAGLAAGTYQVQYTAPSGEVLQSGPANNSTGLTGMVTLTAGQTLALAAETLVELPATLTGSVTDGGAGQVGVTVTLLNASGGTVATTTSGADGTFSFSGLMAGNYQVEYAAPSGEVLQSGPASAATGLTGVVAPTAGQTLVLAAETLAAAPATLTGSVTYGGAGQAGATVMLLNSAGAVVAGTTSGGNGAFGFTNLSPGTYRVQYAAPSGEVLQSGPANVATGLTAALTLAAGQTLALAAETLGPLPATLTGSVTYAGAGQAGVTVTLLNAAGSSVATTTSDASGAFAFSGLAAGAYRVKYTAPSGEVLQSGPANVATGATAAVTLAAGQTLALAAETLAPAPATLTGSVVYGGAGQAGVVVTLLTSAGGTVASTATDGTGAFAFTNLAAGSYQVAYAAPSGELLQSGPASSSSGETGVLTLAAGQTLALAAETLAVAPATLAGSVIYGGAGQSGVTVTLLTASGGTVATATTDGTGGFSFANLAAGTYEVQYTAPSGEVLQSGPANSSTGLTGAVALAAGQAMTLPAEVLAAAPATLSGSVSYSGAGEAGVTVALLNGAGATINVTTTSSTGAFSFSGLAAGSYQIYYTAPSGQVLQTGSEANAATGLSPGVTLVAGQTATLPAELLLSNPGTIKAQVLHFGAPTDAASGTGEGGVTVSLLNASGQIIATTTSSSTGAFSFGQLAPGGYSLQYTAPSGQTFLPGAPENATTGVTAQMTVTAGKTVTEYSAWLINTLTFNGFGVTEVAPAGGFYVTGDASSSSLTLGNGNQYVTLTGTGNTIVTGTGSDTIGLSGIGNTITVGKGASYITAGAANDTVHAAGGGVHIYAYGGNNLLDGGGLSFLNTDGSANNKFVLNSAGQGLTTISGFNTANSNILDLQRTLAGTNILPDLSNLGSFVTAVTASGNTTLYVDPTGGSGTPTAFAVLSGVQTTVAALQALHEFSLS